MAGLVLLFVAALGPHLLTRLLFGQSHWPRRFLRSVGWMIGVRPVLTGPRPAPHTLLLANHTSWLDIVILGGTTGAAFVSKAEVGSAPLIGWLADQNHTLYVDRGARRDSHRQVDQVRERLDHASPLAIFPEGRTGDGRQLLPFRSTLLAAVAPAPRGVVVQPVAIDFGAAWDEVAWHGDEPGLTNALRLLARRGTIAVAVRLLDPLPPSADRKRVAAEARAAILDALPSIRGAAPLQARAS